MAVRRHVVNTNFSLGEIDPEFQQRSDLAEYNSAVAEMLNFWPLRGGGAQRRAPLRRPLNWLDRDANNVFTCPYYFAGNRYILLVQVVGGDYVIDRYLPDSGAVVNVETLDPTNPAGIDELPTDFVQVGNSLFLVGPEMPTIRVFSPSVAEFVQFYKEIPGLWSYDGSSVVTSDSPGSYFTDQLFSPGDLVRVVSSSGVSATVATVGVPDTDTFTVSAGGFGSLPFTGQRLFVPDGTAAAVSGPGPCGNVDFHQGRLALSGFTAAGLETQIVFSAPGDPFTVTPGEGHPSAPISLQITARVDNPFQWMLSKGDRLFLGGTHQVISTVPGLKIGLDPFAVEVHDTIGYTTAKPVADDDKVLAVSEDSSDLHSISFDELRQSLVGQPLSLMNHRLSRGIQEIALHPPTAGDPVKRVFGRRSNDIVVWSQPAGNALGAWSKITTPASIDFHGFVRLDSQLFLIVQDTVNAKMGIAEFVFNKSTNIVLDFKHTLTSGLPQTTWSGADPILRSETVFSVVDGLPDGYVNVAANGVFTTNTAGTTVTLGFVYDSRMRLLEPQIEDEKGPSIFRKRKKSRVIVRIRDTAQLFFNEVPLLTNMLSAVGTALPDQEKSVEIRLLGWQRDSEDVIQGVTSYNAIVEGISREVVI